MSIHKYRATTPVDLSDRQWPSRSITQAPIWCSVDLRDGNQALKDPMSISQKLEMFQLLVQIGFKEIEIGFPSASQVEYDFLRTLIEDKLIPEDITVQVLTQARDHLIEKTFESLKGVKKAIVHLYNATSELQRRVVFRMNKAEILKIAVDGAKLLQIGKDGLPGTQIRFEYSPESFTGTEIDYALEVCEAVIDVWKPTPENKAILNLPATVEMSTPNIYADSIEWFSRNISCRDSVTISLHTHNDRGTGVAASELALMAGADRVEGTLFGNGERTGNLDITTMALNMFSQGVDPHLDLTDIQHVVKIYGRCTGMIVHPRHPYAGELVYTAFSGSHQDAISKGMHAYDEAKSGIWEVPYLPIDPRDLGCSYEAIIRINSQSGKGGVAYIMETDFGYKLPKAMHPDFGKIIQNYTDRTGTEATPQQIHEHFKKEYLNTTHPFSLQDFQVHTHSSHEKGSEVRSDMDAELLVQGKSVRISGKGNGPIDAFAHGIRDAQLAQFRLTSYDEHALEKGSDSHAAAYIEIETEDHERYFGVGVDVDISVASMKAILSALNRAYANQSLSLL
ncbi:2-isopropylmalate synthase [Deltaproteobacteria bacterium TL4]